jgi:hypothetical protein
MRGFVHTIFERLGEVQFHNELAKLCLHMLGRLSFRLARFIKEGRCLTTEAAILSQRKGNVLWLKKYPFSFLHFDTISYPLDKHFSFEFLNPGVLSAESRKSRWTAFESTSGSRPACTSSSSLSTWRASNRWLCSRFSFISSFCSKRTSAGATSSTRSRPFGECSSAPSPPNSRLNGAATNPLSLSGTGRTPTTNRPKYKELASSLSMPCL